MPTAVAPANIAFIKYWGMRDPHATLPFNGSLSMNLDACLTTTNVTLDEHLTTDEVILAMYQQPAIVATGRPRERVVAHLDRLRALAGSSCYVRVQSVNTFPADAGIASSAAGFAALTLAGAAAFGLPLDTPSLSRLARRSGSGSAARSIPTGYVEWYNGDDYTSFAESIAAPEHWDLADVVAVVDTRPKQVGSAENHRLATTSPYFNTRLAELETRLPATRAAILARDFEQLALHTEADAIAMHVVCMTQTPPSFYWSPATLAVMAAVRAWRAGGLPACYTMDAGANVHVICEGTHCAEVERRLQAMPEVQFTIANRVGVGARLLPDTP